VCFVLAHARSLSSLLSFFRKADYEKRVDPNDKEQMSLLEEMKRHVKKVGSIDAVGKVLSSHFTQTGTVFFPMRSSKN